MTDFQDFLRHEYVHVSIGEFKPGKFEEAKQLYEEAISTYTTGFKGAFLLQEPGTDRGISLIFWESTEDMEFNQSRAYRNILRRMMPLFVKTPSTVLHEVACGIQPSHKESDPLQFCSDILGWPRARLL